eukprot:8784600-Alexandrium_andersonii.AAC.1
MQHLRCACMTARVHSCEAPLRALSTRACTHECRALAGASRGAGAKASMLAMVCACARRTRA